MKNNFEYKLNCALIKFFIFTLLILFINKKEFISIVNVFNFIKPKNNRLKFKQYFQFNDLKIKYFEISLKNYSFSFIYKKVKIEYNICFFDKNNNIIPPSYLFFNNLQLMCHIQNQNITIDSLSNIYPNKYFYCIEFFNTTENIQIGIVIYRSNEKLKNYDFFFNGNLINYNNLSYLNNTIFDPLYINEQYISLIKKKTEFQKELRVRKIYIRYPICNLKRNIYSNNKNWIYRNIYNHYFCYCIHQRCNSNNESQSCKYFFYISIIEYNKYLYNKTHYLFSDFIFSNMPNDDTFPIFKEMIKRKYSVHYITEKKSLYHKYCYKIEDCLTIIPLNRRLYNNYGDFLQKYFILFLKVKVVISGRLVINHKISQLFYNLEYTTYIAVGHGVCYFKYDLYTKNQIYGINKNNKLLLPDSKPIITIAKKYGWKDKDIIRCNLPRWDKYDNDNTISEESKGRGLKSNSIFIMFTWRHIKKNKIISIDYIKNIINLLFNDNLNHYLVKYNIILYFSLHRFIYYKYKKKFEIMIKTKKNTEFIGQKQISECLTKTNLAVSDFSSIVFDLMYRKKPIIIYIPDANDPTIKDKYQKAYFQYIQSLKSGKMYFENVYVDLNETINKIIYYIKNNFTIDKRLQKLYDYFGFKVGNSINNFIPYLEKLS